MNKANNNSDKKEDLKLFWKKVLGILETELNPTTYNTWVKSITPNRLTEDFVELAVPMKYNIKQLEKYDSLILDAINRVAGSKIKVEYVVKKVGKNQEEKQENLGPLFEPKKPVADSKILSKANLNPRFTFQNFVMGNSNQLAYAIAQAVSEKPGESYNPFFLYSGVGLGKTHLVQAIGNKILQNNPKMNVVYTTGESFMNELIEAIQSGGRGKYTSNEFRKKFRQADVLLIDDIQFIIGRESTQLEFFHTFNALYMAGKQIVLTSDRPPKDFNNLEKRITSRFGSGIIADIQYPDTDLRTAILRTKRDLNRDNISNEVIDYIAQYVSTNIRELEGAYIQILTASKASGEAPSMDLVERILGKNMKAQRKKPLTLNQILKEVCRYYSVKTTEVKGKRRTKNIVIPRQVAMYLMRHLTDEPLMSIGDYLGGRDHTTVMHGVDKIEDELKEMTKIRQDVENVKRML